MLIPTLKSRGLILPDTVTFETHLHDQTNRLKMAVASINDVGQLEYVLVVVGLRDAE